MILEDFFSTFWPHWLIARKKQCVVHLQTLEISAQVIKCEPRMS